MTAAPLPTYAGDVSPSAAHAALEADPAAVLVDCRTRAEWQFVGVPELGDRVKFVEWQRYPDGLRNAAFLDELSASGAGPRVPVYFICRSGARSRDAAVAATAAGYRAAYNVADGFEGPVGPDGQRTVAGWKADGLPWRQP